MGNVTTFLPEDVFESTAFKSVSLQDATWLDAELRDILTRGAQQYRSYLVRRSVERTSTSPVQLTVENELDTIENSASGLAVFTPISLLADFVDTPTEMGKRQEPVIRGKGVPVWVLVSYATKRHMGPEQISRLWNGHVTEQEVQAALAYWQEHPETVQDRLDDAD